MSDDKLLSVIDFGNSKIRLGIYNNQDNYKYVTEKKNSEDLENLDRIKISNSIENIIIKAEKDTNRHLKNLYVMTDTNSCLSVDISIKKKIDRSIINKILIENIIYETKNIIEKSYINHKIIHLIISKYLINGNIFYILPNNVETEEIILDIKFILIKNHTEKLIRDHFKSKHVSVNSIYNSSYIKTLNYIKNFENFNIKFFIDIGFQKTCNLIYEENSLIFINHIPIGGQHITSDISKIMKKDINEAEKIKKSLKQTNIDLNNHKSNDLCIKVIHARVEEIIDLSFKNFLDKELLRNKKSILIFTGEGSKILSKNSIYLKAEYNLFDDMSFYEENPDTICDSCRNYVISEKLSEATIIPKKIKKQGFFEKLFYKFSN